MEAGTYVDDSFLNIIQRGLREKEAIQMMDRALTPLTNEHFAAFCRSMLGQPYWYGTVTYKCTESLRSRKAKQYPSHYGSSRTKRYQQDIKDKKVCSDCIGGLKGYLWTFGGRGVVEAIGTTKTFTSKYGNLCPDKSANGMFSYAKSKGLGRNGAQNTGTGSYAETVGQLFSKLDSACSIESNICHS